MFLFSIIVVVGNKVVVFIDVTFVVTFFTTAVVELYLIVVVEKIVVVGKTVVVAGTVVVGKTVVIVR